MQGQAHCLNHSTRPLTMLGTSERWGWRQSVRVSTEIGVTKPPRLYMRGFS